ncbi:DUF5131 family protein, partial [bacterium]|nr:DUF5131 family protein [bacterium]
MTIEKSIGWTDMTLNPIKGKCKGNCWYCYYSGERGIAKRFKHNPKINLNLDVFFKLPKSPKKIFLCSTHDLFGDWIPSWWRTAIFERIEAHPQHTFQILTKFPQNIDRPMPDNVWLGVTITRGAELWRIKELMAHKAIIRFVSYEPFLQDMPNHCLEKMDEQIDWLIVGRLTGHGRKYNPNRKSLIDLVGHAKRFNVPLFLKDNLK